MKKNEEYVVEISGYTTEGFAVAKLDSFVLFIPGLLKGEKARVTLTKVEKTYAFARISEILEKSKERVEPSCSIARLCGGCQLQFMSYKEQLSLKQEMVQSHFLKHHLDLGIIQEILPSPKQERYRNKVQVPIQEKDNLAQFGFYRKHSHDVVVYEDCKVETEESNQITHFVRDFLNQHHLADNFRYLFIRHVHRRDELMVMPIVRKYPFVEARELGEALVKKFSNITSFSYLLNPKETNVILDGPIFEVIGPLFLQESLLGMEFQLSAKAFFQVNPYATEILYTKALELADILSEDTVVDLYCGFRVIIMIQANSSVKSKVLKLLPKLKTEETDSLCVA
ncbi:23S rRNA (uracil(1939)-C(5))-methyltransferase RlmD [Bulleidia sp. zg-1006]|uniref:23S rRNA (uracil(1939)-C(5))-methyltransferase RlmD n=1 Tax=Bulleidia sp. zg-1006 TaxID=2806552 RepID=UPI001939441C|nr:23S rRNA (uracil(1939)-C(5))-methyltransferase RlmD [Bulleidia sp. zg-1006]QRG86452.1 23S rRNA (uracil(1939)-C(5))-methyltransferase RlmD [Bulleidia sp. zg-1006]